MVGVQPLTGHYRLLVFSKVGNVAPEFSQFRVRNKQYGEKSDLKFFLRREYARQRVNYGMAEHVANEHIRAGTRTLLRRCSTSILQFFVSRRARASSTSSLSWETVERKRLP